MPEKRQSPLMSILSRPLCSAVLLAMLCVGGRAVAQEPSTPAAETAPPVAPAITVAEVEESIRLITENTALDDATKSSLLALYNRALDQARIAAEYRDRTARYEEEIRQAPAQAEALQTQVTEPAAPVTLEEGLQLVDYEQRLIEAQSALEAARQQVNVLQAETDRRTERRREVTEMQTSESAKLQEIIAAAEATPPAGDSAELILAEQTLERAQRQASEAKLKAYDAELRNYDIRRSLNLVNLRTDAAVRERRELEERVNALETRVQAERQRLAQQTANVAAQAAEDVVIPGAQHIPPDDPAREWIESLLEENRQLAVSRTGTDGVPARITTAKANLAELDARLQTLSTEFTDLQTMVDKAQYSAGVGSLLRTQRRTLPEIRVHQRNMRQRSETLVETDVAQTELTIRRRPLSDIETLINERLGHLSELLPENAFAALEGFVRTALNDQKTIIDQLLADYGELFETLVNANVREQEIIDKTKGFETYIDERVFWVRSGHVLKPSDWQDAVNSVAWLLDVRHWRTEVPRLLEQARRNAIPNVLLLIVFAVLFGGQSTLRKRLRALGEEASNSMCVKYFPTVRAFLITIVIAGVTSAFMAAFAWRIMRASDPTDYARALATGLLYASLFLFAFELFRQVLRPHGLAIAHFGWPEGPIGTLRRHAIWLSAITVPVVFIARALNWHGDDTWSESLGRLFFIVNMIAIIAFVYIVLRKNGPVRTAQQQGLLPKSRSYGRVAYLVAIVLPAALAIAAIVGYYYTAGQLAARFLITVAVALGFVLVRGMALRWLTLTHRRIAIAQYRERIKARAAAKASETAPQEEDKLDLSRTVVQTSRLTNSALMFSFLLTLWFIWSGVLPALAALDQIQWGLTTSIGPDGEVIETSITLRDLLLAAFIGVVTVVSARNIPGILEIILHKRFALQAGERYALVTIARYILIIVGVLFAAQTIGFGWSKVQWLVAALSLGIGFGLQEIVANFISGIILLFERPIRVGDTVTIGTVSGTVTRIRMRATTITDWDRKDLVVPNKEFITGQLINWSLTDETLRVVISVGVAYGSDTEKVIRTLRRIADENPLVLTDPAPVVLFKGFGDSTLNFELRVFCESIEKFLPVLHQSHMAIDKAFREENIEIAFPQRDLHIRSIKDVVRLSEDGARVDIPEFAEIDPDTRL